MVLLCRLRGATNEGLYADEGLRSPLEQRCSVWPGDLYHGFLTATGQWQLSITLQQTQMQRRGHAANTPTFKLWRGYTLLQVEMTNTHLMIWWITKIQNIYKAHEKHLNALTIWHKCKAIAWCHRTIFCYGSGF